MSASLAPRYGVARAAAVAAACLTLFALQPSSRALAQAPRGSATKPVVGVLFPSGQLRIVSLDSGVTLTQPRLIEDSSKEVPGGLSRSAIRDELFVSLISLAPAQTRIVAVSVRDASIRSLATLPGRPTYPYVDLGPSTGWVYVASDYEERLVALDHLTGQERLRFAFSHKAAGDWQVYSMRVSPEEDKVYFSFHGGCAPRGAVSGCPHGVDWIRLQRGQPERCQLSNDRSQDSGCIAAHGDFVPFRGGIVAATGSGVIVADSVDKAGPEIDVKLAPGNHFMEFALDTVAGIVYGIGSCLYAGGLTQTPVSGIRPAEDVVADPRESVCGNIVQLTEDRRYLVISRDQKPSRPGPGEITVVDLIARRVARRILLPAQPIGIALAYR